MSGDGPTKVAPPLDDIILGEDDAPPPARPAPVGAPTRASARPPALASPAIDGVAPVAAAAPVAPKPSSVAPPSSADADAKDKEKKRQKLTLRIPDDEVSRPTLPSSNPSVAARPARPASIPDDGAGSLARSPDDTLELPARAMPGIDTSNERGWTPYQPPVAENGNGSNGNGHGGGKTLIDIEAKGEGSSPPSEEIPVDTDITGEHDAIEDEPETAPRLPLALDSEEIKLDDAPERSTDPGDAPEVDIDDLVSVESIPTPAAQPATAAQPAPSPAQPAVAAAPAGAAPAAPAAPAGAAPAAPVAPAGAAPAAAAAAATAAAAPTPAPPAVAAKQAAAPPPPGMHPGVQKLGTQTQPTLQRPQTNPGAFQPAKPGAVVVAPVGALAPPPMNEAAAANKKKVRPWWEELFNDDYIRTMAKISDPQIAAEATFIEDSLGCESGAMILDLACGTGRHAVELAKRGYQVVGYDLSLSMLARASDEAQERGQKINFVQGDMREMTFEETFDGIYTWNTSFGFFDEEKNNAVIAKVHRALKKGGQFLLDVVNRDYIVRQAPSLAWFEGDGCICMDEMQIDFITSRMKVKRTLMMDDGRTKEIEYSIRVYALHELGKMLHDNGFRVAEVSGRTGTPGVFFGCESPRTLILAEKR